MLLAGIPFWIGSGVEARILNKEFGTSYTRGEVFWGGDAIKEIVQGRKHRVILE